MNHPAINKIILPETLLAAWQKTINLLAETVHVPAALIMRVHSSEIEVFISSQSSGNVYEQGEKGNLDTGLYCETVMNTRKELLVSNALIDPEWDHNPDIELGMISYCGLPITWPSGEIFGTICILDIKENNFSELYRKLLEQFRDAVQAGLAIVHDNYLLQQAQDELQKANKSLGQRISEGEERFRLLSELSIEGLIINRKGEVLDSNASVERMFGYTHEEFINVTPATIIAEESMPTVMEHIQNDIEAPYEVVGVKKDGTYFPIEIRARMIKLGGELLRVSCIQDISERKQAEEAARKDQALLQAVVDTVPGMISAKDIASRYIFMNNYQANIYGTTPEIAIGKRAGELLSHGYGAKTEDLDQEVIKTGNPLKLFEETYADALGGEHTWLTTKSPVRDESGQVKHIVTSAIDITERKQTDAALRESNRSIELLQRVSAIANESQDVNEALQTCLDLVCDFTNWPVGHLYMVDEVVGDLYSTEFWHLNPPDQFEAFRKVTEETRFAPGVGLPGRVLTSGEPAWIIDVNEDINFPRSKLEIEIGIKAGFAFPILVGSNVIAVLEFFSKDAVEPLSYLFEIMNHIGAQLGRAIERSRAGQMLLDHEKKLRSIIQSSNVTAILAIDDDGNLVTWNPGAVKLFGYSEDEILGQPLTCVIPKKYRDAHVTGLRRALETGKYNVIGKTVELSGLHKDGHEFPLELSLGVWEVGKQKYFSAIINDITERKKAEERIQQLAYSDSFTGMPNEVFFLEQLHENINQSRQGFVASIELSGLGDIVGTFGLEASELIIYQTGKRLTDQMNDLSIAARTGERLFKILYITNGETENDNPRAIAKHLYQSVSDPFDLMGSNVFVNVYMGVAKIDPEKSTVESILTDVGIAHHEAEKSIASEPLAKLSE